MVIKIWARIRDFFKSIFTWFFKPRDHQAKNLSNFQKNLTQFKKLITETDIETEKNKNDFSYVIPTVINTHGDPMIGWNRVQDSLASYDAKPFYKRWWMRQQNSHLEGAIRYERSWLAREICKPFLSCQSLSDSNFSIPEKYLAVFPAKWKKILSKLTSNVFIWHKHNNQTENTVYLDTLGHYRTLNPSEIKVTRPLLSASDQQLNVVESTSSQTLIVSRLETHANENKQLKQNAARLICGCGFLNLDYKTATSKDVLKELRKLYLEVHPDKTPNGTTDNNGNWEEYCVKVVRMMNFGRGHLFDVMYDYFKNLTSNDDRIMTSIFTQSYIDETYQDGKSARVKWNSLFKRVMVTTPEKFTQLHKAHEAKKLGNAATLATTQTVDIHNTAASNKP